MRSRLVQVLQALVSAFSHGDLRYAGGVSYCSETWQGNVCMRMLLLSPSLCGLLRLVVVADVLAPPSALLYRISEVCDCTTHPDSLSNDLARSREDRRTIQTQLHENNNELSIQRLDVYSSCS